MYAIARAGDAVSSPSAHEYYDVSPIIERVRSINYVAEGSHTVQLGCL